MEPVGFEVRGGLGVELERGTGAAVGLPEGRWCSGKEAGEEAGGRASSRMASRAMEEQGP